MAENKTSILLSDVSIEGDLIEKDKIIIDSKINGVIKAEEIETHQKSNIKGNISSNIAALGGQMKGNVSSNQIKIKKTANIEGLLNQKTLSIEEGATLKIKTQTVSAHYPNPLTNSFPNKPSSLVIKGTTTKIIFVKI